MNLNRDLMHKSPKEFLFFQLLYASSVNFLQITFKYFTSITPILLVRKTMVNINRNILLNAINRISKETRKLLAKYWMKLEKLINVLQCILFFWGGWGGWGQKKSYYLREEKITKKEDMKMKGGNLNKPKK